MTSNTPTTETSTFPYTRPDSLVRDFASRGVVFLSPDSLGISPDVHTRVYEREKQAYLAKEPVTPSSIPDVLDVLSAPGLVDACNRLIGDDWAIVPFTHNASFTSGPRDQHWHKDDNGPYNSRKQRHHQPVQIEMLYYPQFVREDMGPTAVIPYSQYWTFNHEENHDNFAGADHLDFTYHISGMERQHVSGPDSEYDVDDIVNRRTPHDIRMRDAVTGTGWPLVRQLEAAPLEAGSVVIYSHNTFHRGNHRRDDWRTWRDNPRFMWRFWLYRTSDPAPATVTVDTDWSGVDPVTDVDLAEADRDVTAVWRYHEHWIQTGQSPPPDPETAELSEPDREREAHRLAAQLREKGEAAEPARIGAAYRLAAIGDAALAARLLGEALLDDRESVRRAATYGLIAVGNDATPLLLDAIASPVKWVRKAGVYGIGDASQLTREVLDAVVGRLTDDPSVYVRSVAAGTLGCLARRAVATGTGVDLIPAGLDALIACLAREENRVAMDIAQGRSIKFVRPTDDCDVCEGGGIDLGHDRFARVRSAVRENALWSIVIIATHADRLPEAEVGRAADALTELIRTGENVICVGLAMDALARFAQKSLATLDLPSILGEAPVRPWEALVRAGLGRDALAEFAESA